VLKLFIFVILVASVGEKFARAQNDKADGAASPVSSTPVPSDSVQILPDRQSLPRWYDFVGNLPGDMGSLALLSVEVKTIPTLAAITVLTLGLVATDHETYTITNGFYERSTTVASVSDFFVSLGDGKSPLILAGALGAYGFAASDHRALRTASQTLEVLLATGLVVQTLKHISGRESPSVATSPTGTWRPFPSLKTYHSRQSRYHAFPSEHIATTMATVTVLVENYPELGWLKPVGYSIVGLVGISLVENSWHWYSDLPLGIALGYAFGKIVAHPEGDVDPLDRNEVQLSLAPMMNELGSGVRLSLQF